MLKVLKLSLKNDMYKTLTVVLAAMLLTGCSSFDAPKHNIIHNQFVLTVREDPNLMPPNVRGTADLLMFKDTKHCIVTLRKYPQCLLHEVRHCIEEHWHDPKVPNGEDC